MAAIFGEGKIFWKLQKLHAFNILVERRNITRPSASENWCKFVSNSPKPVNHCLTMKEGPKAKYDHIRRFPAHDFL